MSKVLSICIPVFNKYAFTRACLQDLMKLPDDHEIIVVDNGSSDETENELKNNPRIVYHRYNDNKGFAVGCNTAYSLSTAPNVLFLNNDIRVKSDYTDWTNALIKWCPYAMVGPTMGQLDNNLNFVQEADKVLLGKSYMSGWCVAASKDIWNKLEIPRTPGQEIVGAPMEHTPQIFSEEFGLAYFEDTDLSFRAKQLKIPMEVVSIPVVHFGKQTSKQLNTHKLYNEARNIFVKKWG